MEFGLHGKIPEVEKEKLYERFKIFYEWDPDNERCVRKIWKKHISKKLSDHLFLARRAAEGKARALGLDVDNYYTTFIPFNPTWIKQEFWRKLVQEHWNLDKWQAVSEANKANRALFVEGYHTTGSVGYDVARRRLEDLMGGPQPSVEFFTFSHAKKGTMPLPGDENPRQPVLIDDRARQTVECYNGYMLGKFGPKLEDHPQHDQECWERAVGKRKKGNSYGSGSSQDPQFVLTGKLSIIDNNRDESSVRSHAEAQIQKISQMMEKMKEQHEIEKRELKEQYETQTRESQDKLKKELTDNMAELMKYLPNIQQPPF